MSLIKSTRDYGNKVFPFSVPSRSLITMTSRISGFYKLPPNERLKAVAEQVAIGSEEISQVERGLVLDQAEKMVENVIGMFQVPLGSRHQLCNRWPGGTHTNGH